MMFTDFREAADRIAKLTGRTKEHAIRDLLKSSEDVDEKVAMALMLTGKIGSIGDPSTTGIKETFIANDLALEGKNSHERLQPFILKRVRPSSFKGLTVLHVWHQLLEYLHSDGRAKDDKSAIITKCMTALAKRPEDAVFLLRLLTGKTGNGVDDKTILHALFRARKGDYIAAFAFNPDIMAWVHASEDENSFRILLCGRPTPGLPLEPQLCARVNDLEKLLEAHGGETWVQPKLDGMRVHIHLAKAYMLRGAFERVHIFTREQKEITGDYPDIKQSLKDLNFKKHVILDGELVALAPDGSVAPFSLLQKRLGRKTGRNAHKVGVVLYDLLLLDDFDVNVWAYSTRLKTLQSVVGESGLQVIQTAVASDVETLRSMLLQAHEAGEEGLVCKDQYGMPRPGQRHVDWVKLKADYMDSTEFGDSYDLVVVGYDHGKGKRHGTVGALWVAAPADNDERIMLLLCKVGTGFTEQDLKWFHENLEPDLRSHSDADVPVKPNVVIEVKAASVSQDKHGAYSLRFPRFIRVRDDKTPRNATKMSEIMAAMK